MTDAKKISTLRGAIERADKVLDWILADPGHPEWMLTVAKRVRRILQGAVKKTNPKDTNHERRNDHKKTSE